MQNPNLSFSGTTQGNELASFNVASTSHEVGEVEGFSSFMDDASESVNASKFVKGVDGTYQVKGDLPPLYSDGEISSDEAREAEEEAGLETELDSSSGFEEFETQQAEAFETVDVIRMSVRVAADVLLVVQQFIVSIHEKDLRGERVQEYIFDMEDGENSRMRIGVEKRSSGLHVDITADESVKDLLLSHESELREYLAEKNIPLAVLRIV